MGILASLGQRTISDLEAFGEFCRFSGRTLAWVLNGTTRWRHLRLLFPQLYHVGTPAAFRWS